MAACLQQVAGPHSGVGPAAAVRQQARGPAVGTQSAPPMAQFSLRVASDVSASAAACAASPARPVGTPATSEQVVHRLVGWCSRFCVQSVIVSGSLGHCSWMAGAPLQLQTELRSFAISVPAPASGADGCRCMVTHLPVRWCSWRHRRSGGAAMSPETIARRSAALR